MNAMLVFIFLSVGVGLAASRFGERVLLCVPVLGVLLTALYLALPRYM
jgi:hypothetical protein